MVWLTCRASSPTVWLASLPAALGQCIRTQQAVCTPASTTYKAGVLVKGIHELRTAGWDPTFILFLKHIGRRSRSV